jgi:drug/metabolite transporter (DMT)-like permease
MGRGEVCSLASAACWALGVIAYKRLGESLPPFPLNLFKNGLVFALLLVLCLFVSGPADWRFEASELAITLVSGLVGIGLADTLYFRALNALGAARMGVLGNLYSPFVILLSAGFLGERLTAGQFAGFALVSAGVLVIASVGHAGLAPARRARAFALGALSIVAMAVAIVMVKRVLEGHSVWTVSLLRVGGGVAGLLVFGWVNGESMRKHFDLGARRWVLLAVAALLGQFLAMLFWMAGYKYTSASVAAVLNETASVFIVLFAWLLLGEAIARRKLVGIALTLGGVMTMLAAGR